MRITKALIAATVALAPCAVARAEPVVVSAEPYLWAPTISGTLSLGGLEVPLDVGPGELVSGIRSGIMGYSKVQRGKSFIAAEVIAADFRQRKFAPILGQDIDAQLVSIEAEAGYEIVSSKHMTVAPFAGIRYNYLKASAGMAPANIAVRGEWTEPLIGMNVGATLTENWKANLKINHGLGGGNRRSFDARADVDYRFAKRFSLFAGYRHSDHVYRNNSGTPFGLDLHGNGPLLGVRGRF